MKLKITVHGVAYEVDVEVLDPGDGFAVAAALPPRPPARGAGAPTAPAAAPSGAAPRPAPAASGAGAGAGAGAAGSVGSPIAGTVVEVKVKPGATVAKNDILLVIEAMKMNTSIAAPADGRIKAVAVAAGDAVREGQILVEYE